MRLENVTPPSRSVEDRRGGKSEEHIKANYKNYYNKKYDFELLQKIGREEKDRLVDELARRSLEQEPESEWAGYMYASTLLPVDAREKKYCNAITEIDKTLTEYVHSEAIEAQGDYRISLGPAQKPMFESLLTGLFTGFGFVDDPLVPNNGMNGVLQPSIEELQFSTPKQTHTDYFEVWHRP